MEIISINPGYFWKNDSIIVKPIDWLPKYIDNDGYYRDLTEQMNPHKGLKAKVIGVEPLGYSYCAVHIAAWEEDKKEQKNY